MRNPSATLRIKAQRKAKRAAMSRALTEFVDDRIADYRLTRRRDRVRAMVWAFVLTVTALAAVASLRGCL